MTEYWKINDEGCIEALTDMHFYHPTRTDISVRAGRIGAKIDSFVSLPKTTEMLWVGKETTFDPSYYGHNATKLGSCYIGDKCHFESSCSIRDDVLIMDDIWFGRGVTILSNSKIDSRTRIRHNTTIYERCSIDTDVRIGSSCTIGTGTRIRRNTKIDDGCKIRHSDIGVQCEIGRGVDIMRSNINDYSDIKHHAILMAVYLGQNTTIGESVKLHGAKVSDHARLEIGNHMILSGCGKSGRNVLFYTHDGEILVSAGCQIGITVKQFKERIKNAHGTTKESAYMYKLTMPIMDAIIKDLKFKIFKKKISNFFS